MKAHGHLLGRFIQEKTGELTAFFVTEGLIALILVLEGLDLTLFWVAFFTPFLVFLVFQVLGYIKFIRLHQFLTAVDVTTLPDFPDSSRLGRDYQALIFELNDNSQKKYQALADFDKDLLDLTKLWTHQMKVPLSALDLMVQTDRLTNQDVENQVIELDNYITILLSYLRLQHTATDFRFEVFDVADVVHVIIKKYANQFILKDLSVSVIGSWQITSDKKWLSVALEQLINNAVKYTKKGSVAITLDHSIDISDTGIGILAEDIPRIFEHGFTGFNGRKYQKSTGLGLYLTQDILKKLAFDIHISSQIEKGTTVHISKHIPVL